MSEIYLEVIRSADCVRQYPVIACLANNAILDAAPTVRLLLQLAACCNRRVCGREWMLPLGGL